ncbi:hypothetical protein M885DRAFT_233379, partial [Pelagophyceae sp. CCMP2097]
MPTSAALARGARRALACGARRRRSPGARRRRLSGARRRRSPALSCRSPRRPTAGLVEDMRARRARPCTNAQAYGKFGKTVRWHWVRLCIDHNWTASKIAQDFNKDRQFVHHSTIYKCLKIFWRTGDVVSPRAGRRSRPGILTDDDWLYLVSVLDSRPDLLLDEMRDLPESYSGITYSISTLCATLQRHGYTRRVLKQIMVKRDRAEEATFIEVYNRLPADLFVWIDETRKDPHGLHRRHGYGVRGGRTYSRLNFGRGKSFSALAVLTLDGIIDYNITSARGVKAVDFCNMLYHHVIPHMQKWPKRRSIL